MKTPIERMLDDVKYEALPAIAESDKQEGIPWATHKGILKIGELEIECYVLSDGQRVIGGKMVEEMVEGLRSLEKDEP